MSSKKKHTAKGNVKMSDLNHSPSSQKQDHGVEISSKMNSHVALEMNNTLKSSGLETQLKVRRSSISRFERRSYRVMIGRDHDSKCINLMSSGDYVGFSTILQS
jgi:hypothetical protein